MPKSHPIRCSNKCLKMPRPSPRADRVATECRVADRQFSRFLPWRWTSTHPLHLAQRVRRPPNFAEYLRASPFFEPWWWKHIKLTKYYGTAPIFWEISGCQGFKHLFQLHSDKTGPMFLGFTWGRFDRGHNKNQKNPIETYGGSTNGEFPICKNQKRSPTPQKAWIKTIILFNLFDHPINMVLLGKIDGLIWYTIGCIIYLPIGWFWLWDIYASHTVKKGNPAAPWMIESLKVMG